MRIVFLLVFHAASAAVAGESVAATTIIVEICRGQFHMTETARFNTHSWDGCEVAICNSLFVLSRKTTIALLAAGSVSIRLAFGPIELRDRLDLVTQRASLVSSHRKFF
jgi:hypothetical protein